MEQTRQINIVCIALTNETRRIWWVLFSQTEQEVFPKTICCDNTETEVAREDNLKTSGDWRQLSRLGKRMSAGAVPAWYRQAGLPVRHGPTMWTTTSLSSSLFTNNVQFVQRLCQLIVHIWLKGAGCWRSVTRSINDGLVVCIKLGTGLELSCCQWQALWPHPCSSERTLHRPRVVLLSMTGSLTAYFPLNKF